MWSNAEEGACGQTVYTKILPVGRTVEESP